MYDGGRGGICGREAREMASLELLELRLVDYVVVLADRGR